VVETLSNEADLGFKSCHWYRERENVKNFNKVCYIISKSDSFCPETECNIEASEEAGTSG